SSSTPPAASTTRSPVPSPGPSWTTSWPPSPAGEGELDAPDEHPRVLRPMSPTSPSAWPKRVLTAVVVGLGLLLAACAKHAPQTTLKPQGPAAHKINGLFDYTLIWAGVFFVLVEFGVVFLVIRYRHRDDKPEPVQVHGNTRP